MNEKLTSAFDKILGVNTTAVISLGAVVGGLLYAGIVIGDFAHRLVRIEERSVRVESCASVEQCESIKPLLEGLERRTSKLEWKSGITP